MKTLRALRLLGAMIVATLIATVHLTAQPFGQWDFDAGNLNATVGATPLAYSDGPGGPTQNGTTFGSTATLGIPLISGTNAFVMRFPAATGGMGFNLPTPPPNGRGSYVDNYSLVLDVLYPAASDLKARPILETDEGFISSTLGTDLAIGTNNGLGLVGGTFDGTINSNTWYRIGLVVQQNNVSAYINGARVGSQNSQADRLVLEPSSVALLLAESLGTDAAVGYVNSIQLRDVALTASQMQALGGPSAEGIPQVIPAIPSFVVSWTPAGAASRTVTDIGVVLNPGDASVDINSIVLKLNSVAQTGVQVSSNGLITVLKTAVGPLTAGSTYTLEVSFTDSQVGAKSFSKQFKPALLFEDFEQLVLGTNVQEGLPTVYTNVWTKSPPPGWSIDDSGVPGVGDLLNDGVTEWAGWSFASNGFWGVVTDNQDRQLFTYGSGTVAVADGDEWDDAAHPLTNYFSTILKTAPINISGVAAGTIFMKFDSSWRPEGADDWAELGMTNNQTALITASFDGGPSIEIMRWSSLAGPNFHDDSQNERVSLLLNNPAGRTNLVITFGYLNAANDWWWAFDNVEVNVGDIPSSIVQYTPTPGLTNVGPRPTLGAVISRGTTVINPASAQILLDGVSVPVTVTTNVAGQFVISGRAPGVLPKLTTHTNTLIYTDSLNGLQSTNWTFTVANYDEITLGTPVWIEDFNGVLEAALPPGWVATNRTSVLVTNFNFSDPDSAAYENFVVISTNRLGSVFNVRRFNVRPATLNGQVVETLMSGNLLYGESDNRGGNQVQVAYSPVINLSGITGVKLVFNNIYEQNQDSMGAVEYSINGGTTWLPALYMVAEADVIAGDPVATLGTVRADQAWGSNYGAFIGAGPVDASFEPFIGARIDDNATDSKRIEVISLPQADNQANVRLRFTHTGTGSWYFGIDDIGFYGNGATNVPVQIVNQPPTRTVLVGQSSVFTVGISPYSTRPLNFQWQKNGTNINGATSQIYTLTNAQLANAGNYRVVVGNVSGSVTSDVAVVTVENPAPNIVTQPASVLVSSGYPASFSVVAQGTPPLSYQWYRDNTPVGQNTNAFNLASATATDAGQYHVVISNVIGAVTSAPAALTVVSDPITSSLVVHLKFDDNYTDSSSRGNNATAVGTPGFSTGKIGQAFRYTNAREGTSFNYATLGSPVDLLFGNSTDFSVSYWSRIAPGTKAGDPPQIGNKNWNSGGNIGFVLGVQGNNNFEWNYREEAPSARRDFDSSFNMADDQWHHVVTTFQRGGVARTFIDGVLRDTRPIINAGSSPTTIDAGLAVNVGQDGTGTYTDGGGVGITNALIDDVGIWRRALTPEEATAIYTAGNAGQHLQQVVVVPGTNLGAVQVARVGGNVQFAWSGGTGIRLQKSTTLAQGSWSDVPGTLGANSYSEPATNSAAHFRLYKP